MSEWNKNLIIKVFSIFEDKNNKYTIIVAINIYNIGINNSDIELMN